MYVLYIIECDDGSLYTGITTDLARRLKSHQEGRGARYTRAHGARCVLYTEEHPDRSAASVRESAIKRMTRTEKLALIQN